MVIDFARSERSTLGLEWELALVDQQTGDLVGAAPELLAAVARDHERLAGRITSELLTNTVEVVSGVNRTVGEGVADLTHTIEAVTEEAEARGFEVICSGTHPFAHWSEQQVTA